MAGGPPVRPSQFFGYWRKPYPQLGARNSLLAPAVSAHSGMRATRTVAESARSPVVDR